MAFSLKCKPCEYTGISQPFKPRKHRGIDLVNHKLYQKTPIVAAQDGTVVAARYGAWDKSYGNEVAIYHGNGNYTNYGHLSKIKTRVGKKVKAGDLIGYMGNTGRSTGTHLHFEIHKGRKWNRVNPKPYLDKAGKVTSNPIKTTKYEVGQTYTLQEDMNVRISYGSNKARVSYSKLTEDAKKHANKDGQLLKGTKVTCKDVAKLNGATWIRTPSGWICAVGSTGRIFIK